MKTQIAIITIANKKLILDDFKKSLAKQKEVSYDLMVVENYHNEYKNAREAYNHIAMECDSDYLIFLHPDIRFCNPHALKNIIDECNSIDDFGVIGIAGSPITTVNGNRVILSTIVHGKNKEPAGLKIDKPVQVQTVDECFFVVKSKWFKRNNFSAQEGWHLYAVELCLDYLLKGKKNYVVPAEIWHLSDGRSLDVNYVKQLKKLINKYSKDFKYINTTVKRWKTSGIDCKLYLEYYSLKQEIKHILRR